MVKKKKKNPPTDAGDIKKAGLTLAWEDPLEEGMATYSSILAWRIPWTEELGGLQSMGSQRVGHAHTASSSTEVCSLASCWSGR